MLVFHLLFWKIQGMNVTEVDNAKEENVFSTGPEPLLVLDRSFATPIINGIED